MIVYYWRLAFLVSCVLFLIVMILLMTLRLLKNKYYFPFEADELIKRTSTSNSRNLIYFTSGITQKYIKKYVVCKTLFDKYVVCNFTHHFEKISYFVVQYTRFKKVISVAKISETATTDTSKVITLKNRCKYVKVIISSVEGNVINANFIRPISIRRIRLFAFLKSASWFLVLFIIRHVLIELIAKDLYLKLYLTNTFNYIAVFGSLLLCFIGYFIQVKSLRRRNIKALSGGALEYEFI